MDYLKEIDNEIFKCHLCSNMIEKLPISKTVSIGKSSDIVILVGLAVAVAIILI